MTGPEIYRELPSVDAVVRRFESGKYPQSLLTAEARRVIQDCRQRIADGKPVDLERIGEELDQRLERLAAGLRSVINATGVVLHTNLGRAPLGDVAISPGYTNLEFDLVTGRRGRRDTHLIGLCEHLLNAPAIVVNNNAAAVYLVLNELAAGGEVVVSRGELIEIGDGFRIPDIMRRAGAIVHEVGTTNKTNVSDYAEAINANTRLILRVHPSNFHISGFTAKPDLGALAGLAASAGIPLYEDLGSGCLVDLRMYGVNEPLVGDSLKAGVSLVSFSGDKLLGGCQAGFIAGSRDLITRLRKNPMFRALRIDKLTTEALARCLRALAWEQFDEIPALRMIRESPDSIKQRAGSLAARLNRDGINVVKGRSLIGGGSTPDQSLETWLIEIRVPKAAALERELRAGTPAVITRMEDDALLLDLRTVFPAQQEQLFERLSGALEVASVGS